MPEIIAAHLERVAKAAYDEWEAWHSEPCEQGQFEGKKYVGYPDMGSLGSEQKFVEVVAAAGVFMVGAVCYSSSRLSRTIATNCNKRNYWAKIDRNSQVHGNWELRLFWDAVIRWMQ